LIFPLALPLILYGRAHFDAEQSASRARDSSRIYFFSSADFIFRPSPALEPDYKAGFSSLASARGCFLRRRARVCRSVSAGPLSWVSFRRVPLPALVIAMELLVGVAVEPFWIDPKQERDRPAPSRAQRDDPGDYVFDSKGETVFSPAVVFGLSWKSLTVEPDPAWLVSG